MGGREGLCEVVCWLPGKRKRGEKRGKRDLGKRKEKRGKPEKWRRTQVRKGDSPALSPPYPLFSSGGGGVGRGEKGKGVGLRGNS
jgi:hypothetical protein